MAAVISTAGATSLEQQAVMIACKLQELENAYNAANASNPSFTPLERVTVEPVYDSNSVTITFDLLLTGNAVSTTLTAATLPHIP